MKKFSDLQVQSTTEVEQNFVQNDQLSFPEYMINDTDFIGYSDSSLQYAVYNAAAFGTIQTGTESVLDVGCGRGDFGNYLLSMYPNINYTGIDLNPVMIDVGKFKYVNLNNFNLQLEKFDSTYKSDVTYDWVYHVTDLTINYGVYPDLNPFEDDNRYVILKEIIRKSLEISTKGVVLILLNNKESYDSYLNYSFDKISEILYELNLPFGIDNSDIPNVFKLTVLKTTFI